MIWTSIELEKDALVLNIVTKLHKYQLKLFNFGVTHGRNDRGNT